MSLCRNISLIVRLSGTEVTQGAQQILGFLQAVLGLLRS